ncbi:hypothetical protein [Natrarchaeobius chitinivorans]|uniref:Uncharacterized protein n=1 Tax=Natrarchaeobius chitinivorans TaxID=1679083 RepID=A0A3N6PI78_NATCH|nr:hypothetical protein [Natrarchaeobius chitinivorans]RQG97925.1 hypothetical protein EA473_01655 [Natrarchaeobius chitinivorans]
MSSSDDHAIGSADDLADPVCDRCDDRIPEERVLYLSSQPCPELEEQDAAVTRTYCPDCIAGIGLLEFAREDRTCSSTKSDCGVLEGRYSIRLVRQSRSARSH